jgi:hypothetical protein
VTLQNFQAWWKRTHDSSKFELSDAMKAIASAPVVDAELVGDAEQSKPETLALPTALGVGQLPQRVSQTSPMADHHAAMRLRHQTMPPTTLHHQTPPQQAPQSVPAPAPLQQLRVTIPYGVTSGAPGFSIHCVNSCANALVLMWRRGFPCSRLDPVAVCINHVEAERIQPLVRDDDQRACPERSALAVQGATGHGYRSADARQHAAGPATRHNSVFAPSATAIVAATASAGVSSTAGMGAVKAAPALDYSLMCKQDVSCKVLALLIVMA